jgi:outer membrane protein assembly factor BamE (lipoprotein component of BamABCDE complex)
VGICRDSRAECPAWRHRCLILAMLCTAVLGGGCAIMGRNQKDNPIDPEKVRQIRVGMSKTDVTALLGAPQEIIFSNKQLDPLREYAYVYEHVVAKYTGISFLVLNFGNADEKKDRVLVFFDDGVNVSAVGASFYSDSSGYGFPFGK